MRYFVDLHGERVSDGEPVTAIVELAALTEGHACRRARALAQKKPYTWDPTASGDHLRAIVVLWTRAGRAPWRRVWAAVRSGHPLRPVHPFSR